VHTGPLSAMVAVKGRKSAVVQVANVKMPPVVTASTANIAQSASGNRLRISGTNFGHTASTLSITLTPTLSVSVVSCTDNLIVIDTGDTSAVTVGTAITVVVATGLVDMNSLSAVTIGSVVAALGSAPDIDASTLGLSYKSNSLVISGSNLGSTESDIAVYLTPHQGTAPAATLASLTSTKLDIKLTGLSSLNLGAMRAVITVAGVRTTERIVCTLQEVVPVVHHMWPLQGPVEGGTTVTMQGTNFQVFHAGELSCLWNQVATDAHYVNSTLITCVTPRHGEGAVAVALRSELSGTITPITDLYSPDGISFDFQPSIFIADSSHHRVLRFNAISGKYVDDFVTSRSGDLQMPWGMSFGPDHNFYVSSGGTESVLRYNGQTGVFETTFCHVPGSPRGLVFHYGDLYVVSALDQAVYRFNGLTGSLKGVHSSGTLSHSGVLKSPWSIKFHTATNDSYISSGQTHSIVRFNQPSPGSDSHRSGGRAVYRSRFDRVWTQEPLRLITGFDFAQDCVYAVSPNDKRIVQYNRTTGARMAYFGDADLVRPIDVFVLGSNIYVCSSDGVRIYNRASSEYVKTHIYYEGMQCASMIRHSNYEPSMGFL
jgi:hypothetical protein